MCVLAISPGGSKRAARAFNHEPFLQPHCLYFWNDILTCGLLLLVLTRTGKLGVWEDMVEIGLEIKDNLDEINSSEQRGMDQYPGHVQVLRWLCMCRGWYYVAFLPVFRILCSLCSLFHIVLWPMEGLIEMTCLWLGPHLSLFLSILGNHESLHLLSFTTNRSFYG